MSIVIGVSGASGSGKSSFCAALLERLFARGFDVRHIPLDRYYKKDLPQMVSPADGKEYPDWNCPESIDEKAALAALNDVLAAGCDIALLDGAFLFCIPELDGRLDFRVFVSASIETRLYRRICRNLSWRGQTAEGIGAYYLKCVRYQEAKFSLASAARADMTVDNEYNFNRGLDETVSEIEKRIAF